MEDLRPIRTEADYEKALAEVEHLWGARADTPEGDRLDSELRKIEKMVSEHQAELLERWDKEYGRATGSTS